MIHSPKQKWRLTLAAALGVVAFSTAQAARADEIISDEVVRSSSTTEIGPTGESVVVSPEKTTIVEERVEKVVVPSESISTTVYADTLDTQKELILRIIAAGMSSGKLSPSAADELRVELDKINAAEAAAKAAGGLTYTRSIVIARDLDKIGAELSNLLPLSPVTPLITGSHFTLVGNQIVAVDDIAFRRGQVEFWISDSLATGKITEQSAAALRDQMNQIADVESKYRAHGDFTPEEALQLYKAFDKVAANLDTAKARDRRSSIGERNR